MQWCYSTLRPISELHDPVDSQHQLECISPPVGTCRPTTCMVTRTYLVYLPLLVVCWTPDLFFFFLLLYVAVGGGSQMTTKSFVSLTSFNLSEL